MSDTVHSVHEINAHQLLGKVLIVAHTSQTGIVPRSPHKETACDVRTGILHRSLIEGARVRLTGLQRIRMLRVKAVWGCGRRGSWVGGKV